MKKKIYHSDISLLEKGLSFLKKFFKLKTGEFPIKKFWLYLSVTCFRFIYWLAVLLINRPRGLMDMASDFGSEDCGFESHRGHFFHLEVELTQKDNLHVLLYGFLDFVERFDQRKYQLCSLSGKMVPKQRPSANLHISHPFAPSKNIAV